MTRDFYMKHVRKGTQNIKRYQMEDVIKPQSLAEHGYHVMNLFLIACEFTGYEPGIIELDKVLNHDVIETLTGDLNKLVKELNSTTMLAWSTIEEHVMREQSPKLNMYSDDTLLFNNEFTKLLKFCDSMEAYLYCLEEGKRGNKNLENVALYYESKLLKANEKLFEYIMDMPNFIAMKSMAQAHPKFGSF